MPMAMTASDPPKSHSPSSTGNSSHGGNILEEYTVSSSSEIGTADES